MSSCFFLSFQFAHATVTLPWKRIIFNAFSFFCQVFFPFDIENRLRHSQSMTIAKLEKRYVFNHKETGEMARKARMKRKLSVPQVAKRMKVSRMYLYELERGRRNWRRELVERYQRALRQ